MNDELATQIGSLHSFAAAHDEMAFAHMCVAALQGEGWAVERIADARFRMDGVLDQPAVLNEWALTVIRSTDTTRPDGAIARDGIEI